MSFDRSHSPWHSKWWPGGNNNEGFIKKFLWGSVAMLSPLPTRSFHRNTESSLTVFPAGGRGPGLASYQARWRQPTTTGFSKHLVQPVQPEVSGQRIYSTLPRTVWKQHGRKPMLEWCLRSCPQAHLERQRVPKSTKLLYFYQLNQGPILSPFLTCVMRMAEKRISKNPQDFQRRRFTLQHWTFRGPRSTKPSANKIPTIPNPHSL